MSKASKRKAYAYGKSHAIKDYLRILKSKGHCVYCGAKSNLTFHHKDPATKSFGLSPLPTLCMDKILRELDKCELVCVKCHEAIHHQPKKRKVSNVQE